MHKSILLVLCGVMALTACDRFYHKHHTGAAVEVGQNVLYYSDLDQLTSACLSPEDSTAVAQQYIKQWVTDILLYEQAANKAQPELEQLVNEYRRSLYIHEQEQRQVSRHMPTDIEDSIVSQYYAEHPWQFVLHEDIIKGVLLVIPNDAPSIPKLRKWLEKPEDNIEHIEKYAYRYASGYELFTDQWHRTNELLMRIPIDQTSFQQAIRTKTDWQYADSTSTYLLHISQKALAEETMPLEYADTEIRKIILSERQVQFLREERDKIYLNALRFKKIHLYERD